MLLYKEAKDGLFSVKTNFDFLEGGRHQLVLVKMLWNSCVPTKVGFFCLGSLVEKIPLLLGAIFVGR